MKGILKKNQIMITALAIMIAIAGYLNFTSNKIGEEEIAMVTTDGSTQITEADAADISLESVKQDELIDIESLDSEVALTSTDVAEDTAAAVDTAASVATTATGNTAAAPDATPETPGEAVFTSSTVGNLASAKLVKEQTRAKNKEMFLEVIDNQNIESSQKQDAIDSMIALTNVAEKEMSAEILLEAKGFTDAVVSMSDGSVDVVVSAGELTDAQRAQIEDIVKRKTGVEAANIIITAI